MPADTQRTLDDLTTLLGRCTSWRDLLRDSMLEKFVALSHDLRSQEYSGSIPGRTNDADLDIRLQAFQTWLDEQVQATERRFRVQHMGERGNGLVALVDIPEGTPVLSIPSNLLLSSRLPSALKHLDQDPLCRQFPSVPLALHVLYEATLPSSSFAPYIAVLPRSFHIPLFYTAVDFAALKPSAAFASAVQLFYNSLRQYIYLHRLIKPSTLPAFSLANYFWALAVVLTRQNNVPQPDNPHALALIPGWDMCNHAAGKMTTYSDGSAIVCDAMQSFTRGDEITICYGPRHNADLLVYSGFSLADNPHDRVPLLLPIDSTDPLVKIRTLLLQKRQAALSPEGLVIHLDTSGRVLSQHDRQRVQLLVLDKAQLTAALRQDESQVAAGELVPWPSPSSKADASSEIHAACAAQLEKYKETKVDSAAAVVVDYLKNERAIYERAVSHVEFE
ncbi:unnamed protein product [Aphanomyces euteiches]